MKRVIPVILITAMLLSLCGCTCIPALPGMEQLIPNKNTDTIGHEPAETLPTEGSTPVEMTEVTEPVATVPAIEIPEDMLAKFTAEDMYRINIFLSNFSEQNFKGYPTDDASLLNFGHIYAGINNSNVVQSDSESYWIAKADMDSILTRFFGKTVNVADPSQLTTPYGTPIRLSDGKYHFPLASGESYSYCSIVTSMIPNGNGEYAVTFDVYQGIHHESMSPYYSYTSAQAKADSILTYCYSGSAIVRDYTRSNGQATYQLLAYVRQ